MDYKTKLEISLIWGSRKNSSIILILRHFLSFYEFCVSKYYLSQVKIDRLGGPRPSKLENVWK